MNRDRLASGTQWTPGDSVDGELQVRRVTHAEDDILRLDLKAFPGVQESIYHPLPVRRSAEPAECARLNIQPQRIQLFIDRRRTSGRSICADRDERRRLNGRS